MIRQISHYFESKTGVYLHPRFILSVLGLSIAILIFVMAYMTTRMYTDSIRTVGPSSEAEEKFDARMRADFRALGTSSRE